MNGQEKNPGGLIGTIGSKAVEKTNNPQNARRITELEQELLMTNEAITEIEVMMQTLFDVTAPYRGMVDEIREEMPEITRQVSAAKSVQEQRLRLERIKNALSETIKGLTI